MRHGRQLHHQDRTAETLGAGARGGGPSGHHTKQGRAVAVLVSIERMEAIAETMELLADRKAMAAIRKHREGRAIYHDLSALDEI